MKSHYRVVVIGGGIVGASVLYHLTRKGWARHRADRARGTDGRLHLARRGRFPRASTTTRTSRRCRRTRSSCTRRSRPRAARASACTCRAATASRRRPSAGNGCSRNSRSTRRSASKRDWRRRKKSSRDCPIVDPAGLLGGLFDPHEGAVDPHGTTHAFAIAARKRGADVILRNRVTGLRPHADGWLVETEQGTVVAQHVVNAGGLWARRVGRMVGVDLPLTPMQHHYLITEDLPELLARPDEMPCVTDLEGFTYLQQERKGVILGVYERNPRHWQTEGAEWDYGMELLPEDIDRISPELLIGFSRFPTLRARGHPQVGQRRVHVHARRQSAGRPGAGLAQFLGRVRLHGRILAGRRNRQGAVGLDRRGRPGHRHLRHGRRPLRQVRSRRPLPARHHGAVLRAAFRHRLSQRRVAGGPAPEDDAELRGAAGARRALRRGLGHGVTAVFRDRRAGLRRTADVAAVRGRSIRRGGSRRDAQRGGTAGYRRVRALRSPRTGRGAMARPPARLTPARRGPHSAGADARTLQAA